MASARFYLLLGAGGILLLYLTQTSSAGNPTNSSSQVLSSDDNDDDRDDRSGSGNSGRSGSSDNGSSGNGDRKSDTKTETTTTGGAVVRTEQKDGQVRTETRLPSGVRVKTREEEGRARVDIYQGATKLRLERRDDRTIVKLENKEGEQGELAPGQEEVFKIEQRAGVGIKVRAAGNKFVVDQASASATTKFPLSVNLQTNELIVSTPAGERVVTVLPAQAVANMLAANVIHQVRGLAFVQDVQTVATAPGTTLQEVITLTTTRDGVLVYEIPGVQNQRFLGFIPVQVPKTAVVSAETGQLVETTQSLPARLLDLASF